MIKSYLEQMNARERILVGITGVIVIFYIIYLAIYEPITSAQVEATKQLEEKQATLAWMNQIKQHAGKKSRQPITDTSKLLSTLTQQLNQSNLKPFTYQLKQSSGGNVQLSYEKVPFNRFIEWLITFEEKYAITVDRLIATKDAQSGIVKLVVVFKL